MENATFFQFQFDREASEIIFLGESSRFYYMSSLFFFPFSGLKINRDEIRSNRFDFSLDNFARTFLRNNSWGSRRTLTREEGRQSDDEEGRQKTGRSYRSEARKRNRRQDGKLRQDMRAQR